MFSSFQNFKKFGAQKVDRRLDDEDFVVGFLFQELDVLASFVAGLMLPCGCEN